MTSLSPHTPPFTDPAALRALDAIRARVPGADPAKHLPDVHPARIPRHIAIIMDGNGRWAQSRGLDRSVGHRNGAHNVRRILEECAKIGVEVLTLYSFSQENWKRPAEEVAALMHLCEAFLAAETGPMVRDRIRFRVIGDRAGLPAPVVSAIHAAEQATAREDGTMLVLALNYGSRDEIASAARALAQEAASGTLNPADITPELLESRLHTAGLPDPDLLIRTAGELRVSNFLLWQISYSEFHSTRALWPDFSAEDLHNAIRDFASRNRKFGGL